MASTVANTIPNTIVVSEDRNVTNKFRNWYKKKIIDTGISQKMEEGLISYHKAEEKLVNVFGKVVTVVLTIWPADGTLGEVLSILANPIISKGVALKNKVSDNAFIAAKRNFEANFIKADGSSKNITLPEVNFDEVLHGTKEVVNLFSKSDSVGFF